MAAMVSVIWVPRDWVKTLFREVYSLVLLNQNQIITLLINNKRWQSYEPKKVPQKLKVLLNVSNSNNHRCETLNTLNTA